MLFPKKNEATFEDNHSNEITSLLTLVFHMSMSFEAKDPSEFFNGTCFMLLEACKDLDTAYEFIKLGYYKHAYAGLRFAYDCGLYSIYYSDYSEEFKKYLFSKIDSPRINEKFWKKIINMNELLKEYHQNHQPLNKIFNSDELSNYVHTKGIFYSQAGFQDRILHGIKHNNKPLDAQETYNLWYKEFLGVVRAICILHLLRFPILAHVFSYAFLKSKFGYCGNCPFFGGLSGDYTDSFLIAMSSEELLYIRKLAAKDNECMEKISWINSLPDLSDSALAEYDSLAKEFYNKDKQGESTNMMDLYDQLKILDAKYR